MAGQGDPLAPLDIQYPDYAAWQREWLSGERLEVQVEYWRRSLADAPALLELPTDRPRPKEQSFAGDVVGVHIDAELTSGLKRVSQEQGTTLFMTLLGAWAAVLGRLSGQDDLVIGTPSANRNRREVEGLIGFFVNTLALRIDLSGEPSLAELLARVRQTALGAQDHQDLPFEQVVEIASPPRRLDQSPVFQVMFAWQNHDDESGLDLPGLRVEPAGASPDIVKFDLELSLSETDGSIVGEIAYASALFDAATIERQRGYFVAVLRALVADPGQPALRVELIGPAERALLLETRNQTEAAYPSERPIHQLFEEQVRRAPAAIAVVQDDIELTYAELNRQANRLAHELIALGVGPDARVALCVERHPRMVVALLAILKAGGAYVPLDPSYPRQRLEELVRDAAPVLVVCDAAGREALGAHRGCPGLSRRASRAAGPVGTAEACEEIAILALDEPLPGFDPDQAEGELESDPEVTGLTSAHLAYVIYTSGSTGTPKGVMVEHRSLVNHVTWQVACFGFSHVDAELQHSSISFDASVSELWGPLAIGARVVLLPTGAEHDVDSVAGTMDREHVTIAQFVPSQLRLLTQDEAGTRGLACDFVLIGGESLDVALVARARACARRALVNCYGPTEATIDAISWICPDGDLPLVIPIGHPIANARIYVLDGYGEPVPLGAVGELYIGGAGVARGYLDRPELTAERFVADRFAGPGARMYRTGDLARYLPDGNLEFVGRKDDQVKVRGYRIELGEIEARLCEHPAVREAVVVAREVEAGALCRPVFPWAGDTRLVAYVISAAASESDAPAGELVATLRRHLADRLPEYMVPSAFVRLEALPMTPSGKLDRKALPAPDGESVLTRVYEAPQGRIEETLATVWAELLGLERVGRHDHFFELGGHSLLAVTLMERLRRVGLGTEIRALFATPTLAALAATLGSHGDVARSPVRMLDVLPPAERALLLETWNQTEAPYPSECCIHQLFEEQVRRTPAAIAVVQDDLELSYAELNRQANRLAHHLIGLGVGPDARVALCAERHPRMVVGLLAILKAGGAYVPLDPSYPRQRLEELVRDADPVLLVCDAVGREALGSEACDQIGLLALDEPPPELDPDQAESELELDPEVPGLTSAHLAYVIYTSGSTGTPKGVTVEHRSLSASTSARVQQYGRYERFLLLSPIAFDSSAAGIFSTLTMGGTLPVPAPRLTPKSVRVAIERWRITSLLGVPSLLQALVGEMAADEMDSVSEVILAGENCPSRLIRELTRVAPKANLHNEYGPTECTVWASSYKVSRGGRGVSPRFRSGARSPTRAFMCWMVTGSRCRSARWESSTSAERVWRGAISTGRS